MNDSISRVIIKKSLPKILVRAFVWLLSLFAVGGLIDYLINKELKAEAERMEEVNQVQKDSLVSLLDSLDFQVTVVGVLTFENDSLRERTGPIRWKTIFRDTGSVRIDSFPVIVIDSQEVPIPIVIAEELESCRALAPECEKLKVQVDSLLVFIPTVIDSLTYQITVLEEIVEGPKWNLGLFKLPKPKDMCGILAGYNLIGQSISSTTWSSNDNDDEFYTPKTTTESVSRWNITLGCGIGFRMGIL